MAATIETNQHRQAYEPSHKACDMLSPEVIGALGLGATINFAPGQIILVEGDSISHYYRIISGTVRLYKAVADGRRQVIDFLGPNDCFGLTGLDRHAYSVEAISAVTLVRHPLQRLQTAIEHDLELTRRLFTLACIELGQAQRQMLLLGRKSAEERLASFLLDLAERQGAEGRPVRAVSLPMSRLDIADHLGLTIETVSRTFSRFRRMGVLALSGRQGVTIENLDELRRLAEGDADA